MNFFIGLLMAAVFFHGVPAFAQARPPTGVGFTSLELMDPVGLKPMKAIVFFPSAMNRSEIKTTTLGPLEVAAEKEAPLWAGTYPLVLVSHGNRGSAFSHHDTATFLASQGYIVAAIEHPVDNYRELDSSLATDRVLIGRNLQLNALLDYLLKHAAFGVAIDASKIGVAGFSAGAYTALLMVGATPKFELLPDFCARQPHSVVCAGGSEIRVVVVKLFRTVR